MLIHVDTSIIFWLNLNTSVIFQLNLDTSSNMDHVSLRGGSEKQESLSRG